MANSFQASAGARASEDGWFLRFIDRFMPADIMSASEDKKRQVRSAIGFLMASWLMAFVFMLANFRQGLLVAAWTEVVAVVVLSACLPLIRRTGRYVLFGNIGMSTGLTSIFMACWYADGLEGPAVVMLPLVPAYAYLGYGRRSARAWTWVSVAMVVFLFVSERAHWVPEPSSTLEKIQTKRFIEAAFALGFGYLAARIFNDIKDYALSMLEKRSTELEAANAHLGQLFHNMRQGVLAFDRDVRVVGSASAQASTIFGRKELSGANVAELLFADEPSLAAEREAFESLCGLVFDADPNDWDQLAACAPNRIVRHAGTDNEQHMVLELRPIVAAGRIERVMLLVTDETERVRMERAAEARDKAHAKQVDELRRIIAGGAHLVLQFVEHSEKRLAEARDLLLGEGRAANELDVAVAFQLVHTVRGEARAYQLLELETECAALEDVLAGMRKSATRTPESRSELEAKLEAARRAVDAARAHIVEVSPIGAAVLDQVTVRKSQLDEVVSLAKKVAGPVGTELSRAADRLAARPFGESTQQLLHATPLWARRASKSVELAIEGRDELVPPALARVLSGVLTHLVRNAVAHGVEHPSDRERAQKPTRGSIRLRCEARGEQALVTIEDDGRGIDAAALSRAAQALGIDTAGKSADELMFETGLSTSPDVNEVAGRGMGLAAVRRELAQVGYAISAKSEPGRGTRFVIAPVGVDALGASVPENQQQKRSDVA